MKFIANGPVFVILYILVMVPTYFLPYLGSNSAAVMAVQGTTIEGQEHLGTLFFTFVHLACLGVLVVLTWFRGRFVGKIWLIVFPFLAAAFDFIPGLSLIPLVPTVMHLLAIILGASSSQQTSPIAKETT